MSFDSQRESIPIPVSKTLEGLTAWAKNLAQSLTRQREDGVWLRLKVYTVAGLPDPAVAGKGAMVYVDDESGGSVMAVSDATNWRRQTDRAIVS